MPCLTFIVHDVLLGDPADDQWAEVVFYWHYWSVGDVQYFQNRTWPCYFGHFAKFATRGERDHVFQLVHEEQWNTPHITWTKDSVNEGTPLWNHLCLSSSCFSIFVYLLPLFMPLISRRLFSPNCEFTDDIIHARAFFHHLVLIYMAQDVP